MYKVPLARTSLIVGHIAIAYYSFALFTLRVLIHFRLYNFITTVLN